jgi:hypothetical protein
LKIEDYWVEQRFHLPPVDRSNLVLKVDVIRMSILRRNECSKSYSIVRIKLAAPGCRSCNKYGNLGVIEEYAIYLAYHGVHLLIRIGSYRISILPKLEDQEYERCQDRNAA